MFKTILFLSSVFFLFSGCHLNTPATKQLTATISGIYKGQWHCVKSNHTGPITCNLKKKSDNTYNAKFYGFYAHVIPFWYNVKFDFKQSDRDLWHAKGDCDLGWLGGGKYTFDCQINKDTFTVTYDAKASAGTFDMKRKTE